MRRLFRGSHNLRRRLRSNKSRENYLSESLPPPKGIGGWLILVAIGLFVTPLKAIHFLWTNFLPIFQGDGWRRLTTPGTEAFHPYWKPLLIFEIAGNLTVISLGLFAGYHFFMKTRLAPRLLMMWFGFSAVFVLIDFFVANLIPAVAAHDDPDSTKEVIRALVAAIIWVPYFLVSKRVKATFVE